MSLLKTTLLTAATALAATLATLALSTTSPAPVRAEIPATVLAPAATGQVPSLAPMIKAVLPTVVNIAVSAKVEENNPLLNDPFARRFFGLPEQPQEREEHGVGSGVIVDAAKGYILTNNHVVAHADTIKVRLNDDRQFDGKVVGTDPLTDLAVVQIKAEGLTALPLGDSDKLEVGDFVVAIGSPFNLKGTVTYGIVSGKGRSTVDNDGGYQDFIQTDASINPGNSGGGLVDLRGQLVGINSQILSGSGGSIGIGFAIPANVAKLVMAQLIANGKVEHGHIGIVGQDLTPELAKNFGATVDHGTLVAKVVPGTPADKAGLKEDDIITEANGKEIHGIADLRNLVGLQPLGDKIDLTVIRGGAVHHIGVVVGKGDDEAKDGGKAGKSEPGKAVNPKVKGLTLGPTEDGSKGVQVLNVAPDSPAADIELRPGDVIDSVNHHAISSVEDFNKYAGDKDGQLLLHVRRGDGAVYLLLQ